MQLRATVLDLRWMLTRALTRLVLPDASRIPSGLLCLARVPSHPLVRASASTIRLPLSLFLDFRRRHAISALHPRVFRTRRQQWLRRQRRPLSRQAQQVLRRRNLPPQRSLLRPQRQLRRPQRRWNLPRQRQRQLRPLACILTLLVILPMRSLTLTAFGAFHLARTACF